MRNKMNAENLGLLILFAAFGAWTPSALAEPSAPPGAAPTVSTVAAAAPAVSTDADAASVVSTAAPVAVSTATAPAPCMRKEPKDIFWPEPPDPRRVQFARSIRTEYDLKGRRPGLGARLLGFFLGEDSSKPIVLSPYGIWVRGDMVYLADTAGEKVAILDLAKKTVREITGLSAPVGVASDPLGNVYVSDTKDNAIAAFDSAGKPLWKTAELGKAADPLNRPTSIAWTPSGELLVVDSGNGRLVALSKDGKLARILCRNREKEVGALPTPVNLWVEPDGGFIVTDPLMARVHLFTSSGTFVSGFGEQGDSAGYLTRPRGVASDSDGNIYVADARFHRVQTFNRKGELELYFGGPGVAWGQFVMPSGLFIDDQDRIYVVDSGNSRLEILQYIKYPPQAPSPNPAEKKP